MSVVREVIVGAGLTFCTLTQTHYTVTIQTVHPAPPPHSLHENAGVEDFPTLKPTQL